MRTKKEKESGSVSRVLSAVSERIREAVITLDRLLPIGSVCRFSCRQATYPPELPGPGSGLFGLAGGGVCHAAAVTSGAVRSYRTFSPLPVPRLCFQGRRKILSPRSNFALKTGAGPSAVCFLRHFPSGHPGRLLAAAVPCPARTFLPAL